jgi:hypothetical protein
LKELAVDTLWALQLFILCAGKHTLKVSRINKKPPFCEAALGFKKVEII